MEQRYRYTNAYINTHIHILINALFVTEIECGKQIFGGGEQLWLLV